MVIRYSIEELNNIGEMVILRECIKSKNQKEECTNKANKLMQDCEFKLMDICQQEMDIHRMAQPQHQLPDSTSPLTSSVAEFFKKAQQNFYLKTNIDPTKIRRLSEIESEMVRGRTGDSC